MKNHVPPVPLNISSQLGPWVPLQRYGVDHGRAFEGLALCKLYWKKNHGGTIEGQSYCRNYWRNVHGFDVHDSEMDTVLKKILWKKNLTAPNPKIFYIYGGMILFFKGIFFQHLNQNICPPVFFFQYLHLILWRSLEWT